MDDVNVDSWIYHTGGWCPVPDGTLVDVKYRDGSVLHGLPANIDLPGVSYTRDAGSQFWINDNQENDIIAYRIVGSNISTTPGFKIKVTNSLGEFVSDIISDITHGDIYRLVTYNVEFLKIEINGNTVIFKEDILKNSIIEIIEIK